MGRYLNSSTSYVLYKGQTEQPYFVDKSNYKFFNSLLVSIHYIYTNWIKNGNIKI